MSKPSFVIIASMRTYLLSTAPTRPPFPGHFPPPNTSDTDPRLSGTVRQAAIDPTSAPDSVPKKVEQKLEIRTPNNGGGLTSEELGIFE